MSIKIALFDFDGTLIDSNEAVISSLNKVAVSHRGFPFNDEELDDILGKPIYDQMVVLSESVTEALVENYRNEYRAVMDDLTKIYDGVLDLLVDLKQRGIHVGIVSNKGRRGIDHGLNQFNLHDLVEVTVSLDDVVNPKPHPEGIYHALEHIKHTHEIFESLSIEQMLQHTVFVGDSGHDIETAKNAGCMSMLVSWTLMDLNRLLSLNPDFVADSPVDIGKIIVNRV